MALSLLSVFISHNNKTIDAAGKIRMDDGGFGMLDSRVCRRGWIGLENGCTSYIVGRVEIDVEEEIEGRDGMKPRTCAIC